MSWLADPYWFGADLITPNRLKESGGDRIHETIATARSMS